MPCVYDDVPGSWGKQSEGWPYIQDTDGAARRAVIEGGLVPYGSYVTVGDHLRLETQEYVERVRSAMKDNTPPQAEVHPDDLAVDRFAAAMKEKLAAARAKGRGGWDTEDATAHGLSVLLRRHVDKGDPRDVANFCMFLHQRGEAIATPGDAEAVGDGFALVPTKIYVGADAWEAASFAFGGPATGEGEAYTDCTLWIGEVEQDDGSKLHGLHVSCDECPEEGCTTLAQFPATPTHPAPPVVGEAITGRVCGYTPGMSKVEFQLPWGAIPVWLELGKYAHITAARGKGKANG